MGVCEVCNNEYEKTFRVELADGMHVFDSLECAIHVIAPECPRCGVKILGHGVESSDRIFCCKACAREVHVHAGEFLAHEKDINPQPDATRM
jgi:endogenous inhibitor of DNA gyrase (YacG/DUF329 family)